jgi:sulfur carrier protein
MNSSATENRLEIVVNGQTRDVAVMTTIVSLLHELEIPLRGVAVEINGHIVPRSQYSERLLAAGDRLEIVSLVGGG